MLQEAARTFFEDLPEEARETLSRHLEEVAFPEGQVIMGEGSPPEECYLLDEGEVRVEIDHPDIDSDSVLAWLGPGAVLGELGLLDGLPRAASVVAHTAVRARRLSRDGLEKLCRESPAVGVEVLRLLGVQAARKLRQTNLRLADYLEQEGMDPEVEQMVARAVEAQRRFEAWEDGPLAALLQDLAHTFAAHAQEVAELTVAETRLGHAPHKALKNGMAALGVLQGLGAGGAGADGRLVDLESPVGVVFGLVPLTNPAATAIFKILIALRGRNSLILSLHRLSLNLAARMDEILQPVLERHGAPPHLVQWVRNRNSRKKTAMFMRHPGVGLILATGGSGMVKAAYSSGTPALGVGPGNAPCWIAPDADLQHAAGSVVLSKSFDNGLICGAEHNLVVDRSVREEFCRHLEAAGAAVLSPEEVAGCLQRAVDPKTGRFRLQMVGQPAALIAHLGGIRRDHPIAVIVAPWSDVTPGHPLCLEKMFPVLSLFEVDGDEEAMALSEQLLDLEGRGHTAIVHTKSQDRVDRFARRMKASRILVNSPGAQGVAGSATALPPSFTLGCGTFGGTSTTDSVGHRHLLNVKHVARYVPLEEHPLREVISTLLAGQAAT